MVQFLQGSVTVHQPLDFARGTPSVSDKRGGAVLNFSTSSGERGVLASEEDVDHAWKSMRQKQLFEQG